MQSIDSFESQAVSQAQETAKLVDAELKDLQATLKNMESARPFEECTVDDIMKAEPAIEKKVEEMVKKGRWMPAGYKVRCPVTRDMAVSSKRPFTNNPIGEVRRSLRPVRGCMRFRDCSYLDFSGALVCPVAISYVTQHANMPCTLLQEIPYPNAKNFYEGKHGLAVIDIVAASAYHQQQHHHNRDHRDAAGPAFGGW